MLERGPLLSALFYKSEMKSFREQRGLPHQWRGGESSDHCTLVGYNATRQQKKKNSSAKLQIFLKSDPLVSYNVEIPKQVLVSLEYQQQIFLETNKTKSTNTTKQIKQNENRLIHTESKSIVARGGESRSTKWVKGIKRNKLPLIK